LSVSINHTILFAQDKAVSAAFLAHVLDRPEPTTWGPFSIVDLGDGAHVEFATADFPIQAQHYAFLVTEDEFDSVYSRIRDLGINHWADPQGRRPGEFNTNHGGRGVYFLDPSGHGLEVLTAPYGADLQ